MNNIFTGATYRRSNFPIINSTLFVSFHVPQYIVRRQRGLIIVAVAIGCTYI